MIPKSLSASSLQVAELCMARYKAEHIDRGKGESGSAALLGTTVHNALELYVKNCIQESKFEPTLKQLLEFFRMSYLTYIGGDFDTEDYTDGVEMLTKWHKRTDFSAFTVVSTEVKSNFPVDTTAGPITFNYIWDRFDQVGPTEYRVVDYKTNRWGIGPADLKKKIQARAYALAAAIQLKKEGKEVTRIWVEFDMLRHDGPVGIVFSREENVVIWNFIHARAQMIVDTDEADVKPTLNPECNFCPIKFTCPALLNNAKVGGIGSLGNVEDAIDLRAQLEWQKKGIASALGELDTFILTNAKERDEHEFTSGTNRLTIKVGSRRAVDAERVEMVLGPALFSKYGGRSFTVGNVDKLLKGDEIDEETKKKLKMLVYSNTGEPRVDIAPISPIDSD